MHKPEESTPRNYELRALFELINREQYIRALETISRMEQSAPVLRAKGECLQGIGRYDEAINCYLAINWPSRLDLRNLAAAYEKNGEIDLARHTFDRITCKGDQVLLNYAIFEQNQGDYDKALRLLKNINKKNDKVYSVIGECYLQKGIFHQALRSYESIQDPNEHTLVAKARCQRHLGYRAVEIYQSIPNKKKTTLMSYSYYFSQHDEPEWALQVLRDIDPSDRYETVDITFALRLEVLGRLSEAEELLLSIISKNPTSRSAILALGNFYYGHKEEQKAIDILGRLPYDPDALLTIAYCYQRMLNPEKSILTVQQIDNWKTNRNALLCLARTFDCQGLDENAIYFCHDILNWEQDKEALEIIARCSSDRDHIDYIRRHGTSNHFTALLLLRYKQYHKALTILNALPSTDVVLEYRGICHFRLKEFPAAISALSSVEVKTARVLARLAKSYQLSGDSAAAVKIYETIPEKDDKHFFRMASYHIDLGQHQQALEVLHRIQNQDDDTKIAVARCYQKIGEHETAIRLLESLEPTKKNLKSLAVCYSKCGYQGKALAILNTLNNDDVDIAFTTAICYVSMGNFQAALAIFRNLVNQSKYDDKILIAIARVYGKMGQGHEALRILDRVTVKNEEAILCLTHIYWTLGNFDEGLACYHLIKHKSKKVIQSLGIAYQKIGMYKESIEALQSYSHWENDNDILLTMVETYSLWGKYDVATDALYRISHWDQFRTSLLAATRLFIFSKKHNDALECLEKIKNWQDDPEALQQRANCFEGCRSSEVTREAYLDLIQKHPYFQDAFYDYGNFKIAQRDRDSAEFAETCRTKFPYSVRFYNLQADALTVVRRYADAARLLQTSLSVFTHNLQIHIQLLRLYVLQHLDVEADQLTTRCLTIFRGNPKLNAIFTGLKRLPLFVTQLEEVFPNDQTLMTQVSLTESMRTAFDLVSDISQESYIVGSSVLRALDRNAPVASREVEVVVLTENLGHFHAVAERRRLLLNPSMQQVYNTLIDPNTPLNYKVLSLPLPHPSLRISTSTVCDYTISCLYVDRNGNLFDPTGNGVTDFSKRILRPIHDPKLAIKHNPLYVIRAIEYIAQGYQPVSALKEALQSWQPNRNTNLYLIYAAIRKQLTQPWSKKFVEVLCHYQLFAKIFGTPPKENSILTLEFLERFLSQPAPPGVQFWQVAAAAIPHEVRAVNPREDDSLRRKSKTRSEPTDKMGDEPKKARFAKS